MIIIYVIFMLIMIFYYIFLAHTPIRIHTFLFRDTHIITNSKYFLFIYLSLLLRSTLSIFAFIRLHIYIPFLYIILYIFSVQYIKLYSVEIIYIYIYICTEILYPFVS
jgi:hypothetical protein